ncbi:MAG TPA: DEAD/DEAH box helicase [Acidimicrobiales bacterium]
MSSSFADLGVPAEAVRDLRARGISSAFPIQAAAIPPAMAGDDICGRAPTGSGKTIAFGVPVAARVGRGRPGAPRALILAPTRELARQIEAEMTQLMGSDRRRRVAAFYGGVGFAAQLNSLRRGVDLAVACPGRLKDLIARGAISLAEVSIVVIDEADRMADMGFLPDVKWILDQVRPDRQTLLFSATLDGDVDQLVRRYQRAPVQVSVETDQQESTIAHHWIDARREDRVDLAAGFVAAHGPTVVFCRTKHGADKVTKQLIATGVKAATLHGGRTQSQRERALRAFSGGRAHALVATDVAARGIHVDGVSCVIHFDLPATAKDYLHRSGRTGRAGSDGVVISFVTPADLAPARVLQKAVGYPISPKSALTGTPEAPRGAPATQGAVAHTASAAAHNVSDSRREPSKSAGRPRGTNRPRSQDPATRKAKPVADRATRTGRPQRRRSRAA